MMAIRPFLAALCIASIPAAQVGAQAYTVIDSAQVKSWSAYAEFEGEPDAQLAFTILVPGSSVGDTVRRVIDLQSLSITATKIVGVRAIPREPYRELFVLDRVSRVMHRYPVPRNAWYQFHDLAISPDGLWLAYVASDTSGGTRAVIRALSGGRTVLRSRVAGGCDCDVDMNHARWVTPDSFEVALPDLPNRMMLFAGSVSARRGRTSTPDSIPDWH